MLLRSSIGTHFGNLHLKSHGKQRFGLRTHRITWSILTETNFLVLTRKSKPSLVSAFREQNTPGDITARMVFGYLNARSRRRRRRDSFLRSNSCCQMRSTRQPVCRNTRDTKRSRALFLIIFFRQYDLLLCGDCECFRQPCQKQPSTNTASRNLGKIKSGFPNTG